MRHDSTPPAPRLPKYLVWAARTAWWLVLGAWILFALSWGALHAWIVPRIGDWRPQLEQAASRALGTPVRVGGLRAISTGAVPAIELHDVRLFDHEGREALHLPVAQAALSVRSLWRGGFEQLVIDRASLDVRRTADGRWQVAGMDLTSVQSSDQSALGDWFFSQTEFVIRQGRIRFEDETQPQAVLALDGVDLVVRNRARRHLLRLDATPPPELGERFSLRGDFAQPFTLLGDDHWRAWSGTFYAEFGRVDLQRLRQHVPLAEAPALRVHQGQGALRLWADLQRGQLHTLTVDTALEQVRLQLGPRLPVLDVPALDGRVQARWLPQRWEVQADDLRLRTAEGGSWSAGRLSLAHNLPRRGVEADSELNAERIELDAVRELAHHLPLPAPLRAELQAARPRGQVGNLRLQWSGTPWASEQLPTRWRAQGQIQDLSVAAGPAPATEGALGRPGVDRASVRFDIGPAQGQLQIGIARGALSWPGLFEQPRVELEQLQAEAQWRREGEGANAQWSLKLPQLRFANADASGELQLNWHTGAGTARQPRWPGVLDLSARLERADGTRVHRYLPLAIAEPARRYVREAVLRGQARDARFRVKGDLARFPFAKPDEGEFLISAALSDVDFRYVPPFVAEAGAPPWPTLEGLQGRFVIDRHEMRLEDMQGGVAGSPGFRLQKAQARLDDYTHLGQVDVNLRASAPAAEMVGFVNRSPLARMTSDVLAQARFGGPAELQLRLGLPLSRIADSQVRGSVQLPGNDIQFSPDTPLLARTVAQLQFSEQGFDVGQASARAYGGELRFSGGMRPGPDGRAGRIAFQGQGQATAEGLRGARELAFLAPLLQAASGGAPYQVQLAFADGGRPDLAVTSSLQGLALALPAPLDKAAAASLPLRVAFGPLPAEGGLTRDQVSVDAGAAGQPLLSVRLERDVSGADARVLRGAYAVGAGSPAALAGRGVSARLALPALDADAWERWTQSLGQAGAAGGHPVTQAQGYLPTQLNAAVDRLRVAGRELHRVRAEARLDGRLWRARIDADELGGRVDYRPAEGEGTQLAPGRVFARLSHLQLEKSAASDVDELLRHHQPTSVPALDVVVERLSLGTRELGRLELEAVNRPVEGLPGAHEWRLSRFGLEVPEARLSGSGNWTPVGASQGGTGRADGAGGAARRTALNLHLDIRDAGALLERFGSAGVVRGGKGTLEGSIGWLGSPLSLDHPSLSGQLKLDVERGQFLKADPGLAKLLGVLSLQTLPRRLMLDFKDVFSEGFAFDFVRGDARIDKGVASTNNLQMKGVNAAVLLEGQADIARETQDIHAVVVPELNAGTASLIASAINPAVGLGTFLAQFLLRQPLQEAATQQFHISGRWDDPQVERVARKPAPPSGPLPSQ